MNYIDIHTHQIIKEDSIQLLNLSGEEMPKKQEKLYYSYGIHPWDTESSNVENTLSKLKNFCAAQQIIAIGECGLDKGKGAELTKQQEVFTKQLEIAEKQNITVIIHTVKTQAEILALRKKYQKSPWIIHAFAGSPEMAMQYIQHDIHLSFGAALLNPSEKLKTAFIQTPLSSLYLETDDREISIREVYAAAAKIKALSEEELKKAIYSNFVRDFKQ
jgi:TatD DNase family protein